MTDKAEKASGSSYLYDVEKADVNGVIASSTDKSVEQLVTVVPVMDSPVMGSLAKPVLFCMVIAFGGFILGWDIGTIGGLMNMPSFKNHFGTRYNASTGLNEFPNLLLGLIIGIFNVACALGGLTLAKVGDFKGRKVGIAVSLLVYVFGVVIELAKPTHWGQFFIGRIFTGVGVGSLTVLVPMYVAEISPVRIRGSMVVLFQLNITVGVLVGNFVNYGCKKGFGDILSKKHWQVPIALGPMWAAVVLLGLVMIPESSHYLASKDKIKEAERSFAVMNALEVDDPIVFSEVAAMAAKTKELKANGEEGFWEFIAGKPRLGWRLLLGMVTMSLQQLSGVNYFFYYGTSLFNSVGLDDSYVTAIIISAVNLVATFLGIYIVERLGRKACAIIGAAGMCFSMLLYACLGSFILDNSNGNNKPTGAAMIAFTCIYMIFFASTSGPVAFVIISELYPLRTRNTSMAICNSMNCLSNFTITLLTPTIVSAIGYKFGFVFVFFLVFSVFFFYKYLPETKGLTVSEVDELYTRKKEIDEY
ncbi:uncharacterized protein Ecym_5319 [Eremothecium cymbalariae DBVPG|uniref:Major facilitator superfamily (MFS) profile domain-containing protein n=1 Tax=Eremothecium cymbalariae (strain CBS 270.75 / DBVPG 7215 / KCTC 17166 / NRRL Y-17582) TaxID=931890 RepID=I6NDD7_ERECY|nr:hypothetical protein Ecym_5319 [Eremothecium cymbalariae DBVPG\